MTAGRPSDYKPITIRDAKKLTLPLVYGLCAADGVVFYVGKTLDPKARFQRHIENTTKNKGLSNAIAAAGAELSVVVLSLDPEDICKAEREMIRAYKGQIVNMIGGSSAVWSGRDDLPWAAGTGVKCPTAYAMGFVGPQAKAELRAKLAKMPLVDRCKYELMLFMSLKPLEQVQLKRWFEACRHKMLGLLERETA